MSLEGISKEISARICKHMNEDHIEAIIAYAKHYGGCSNPLEAKMIKINCSEMELKVDGQSIYIKFSHQLKNSEDAHKTLVNMLRKIPKASQ